MSQPQYPHQPHQPPTYEVRDHHDSGAWKLPVLFGTVLALIAANIYLFTQIQDLKTLLATNQQSLVGEIGKMRESSAATTAAARRNIESLKDELDSARRQASMAVGQAKVDATRHADEIARKLDQQQKVAEQAVRGEISKVEQVASAATTKIGEVSTEVSNVKTSVDATKSELDKTIADLRSTRGDLGVQSGLIATNSKELSALRALGERNYFEFNLRKAKEATRVGDIMVRLTKADVKRNKYNLEIVADDKKVEKKDKNLNEPVQFYTSKARQPYELVVNNVMKDQIVGYLATPKVAGR